MQCAHPEDSFVRLQKMYPKSLVKLGSFIWIQGESDAADDASAFAYEASLREMLEHLRTVVLNEPTLPIILGVDEEHPWVAERPQVVEAQKRIAAGDSSVIFTSMKGIEKFDASHLPPAGLAEHGDRLFEAYNLIRVRALANFSCWYTAPEFFETGYSPTKSCNASSGDNCATLNMRSIE